MTADFKSFFEEGLANDVFMAKVHYFIYRTVSENALEVNQSKKKDERKHLVYLQDISKQMTLVSLSKIFDRKSRNRRFKVRCLDTLIEECQHLPIIFPLNLELYPDLKLLSSITNINIPSETIDTKDQLISFYYDSLNTPSVQTAVQRLKIVRDKYIVHNEHNPNTGALETFWEDCSFLLDISKLYTSTVGQIFLGTHYAPLQKIGPNKVDLVVLHEVGWLFNLLEEVLGKENYKIWWD